MILIDPRKLRFLRAGRTIRIETPGPHKTYRYVNAGVRKGHPLLRVLVLKCEETDDAFELLIRQLPDQTERYLARSPGAQRRDYVLFPHQALQGEGAVIDQATQRRYSVEALIRDDAIRRERAAKRPKSRRHRYAP